MPDALKPNSTGQGWTVTSQQETVEATPDGRPARGVRVNFTTDRNVAGSVFVTLAMFNPANVKAAIADYVAKLHQVADLSG